MKFRFIGLVTIITVVVLHTISLLIVLNGQQFILNKGIAFGLINQNMVSIAVHGVGLVFLTIFVWKERFELKRAERSFVNVVFGISIGSALSNLIDRIQYGGVIDYLFLWRLPVANLADFLILLSVFFFLIIYFKNEASQKTTENKSNI